MRLVVDTNVILSGLLWQGSPHGLLRQIRDGQASLVESPALLEELEEVLIRPKFAGILTRLRLSPETLLAELLQLAEIVIPNPLPAPVSRDPDDDAVLALAVAAQVDLIVSGDDDLLDLHEYQGIPIVTATEALKIVNQA